MVVALRIARLVAGILLLPLLAGSRTAPGPNRKLEPCQFSPTADHCMGVAFWTPSPSNAGLAGTLAFHCMWSPGVSANFVDEEMWEGTANDISLGSFIEAGGSYGWPDGTNRYLFWADQRPGRGWTDHMPGIVAQLDTPYRFVFVYNGNDTWYVYLSGGGYRHYVLGYSVDDPPYGASLQVGTEITASSGTRSEGTASDLSYLRRAGGWSGDLSAGSDHAATLDKSGVTGTSNGAITSTAWTDEYSGIAWTTNNCDAASSSRSPTRAAGAVGGAPRWRPSRARSELAALAGSFARLNGDPHPVSVTATGTTERAALGALDPGSGSPGGGRRAWLVVMRGRFVAEMASEPNGVPAPRGDVLALVVDAATGRVADWGVYPGGVDPRPLGPTASLRLAG